MLNKPEVLHVRLKYINLFQELLQICMQNGLLQQPIISHDFCIEKLRSIAINFRKKNHVHLDQSILEIGKCLVQNHFVFQIFFSNKSGKSQLTSGFTYHLIRNSDLALKNSIKFQVKKYTWKKVSSLPRSYAFLS